MREPLTLEEMFQRLMPVTTMPIQDDPEHIENKGTILGYSSPQADLRKQFNTGKFTGTPQSVPGKDITGSFHDYRAPLDEEAQKMIELLTGKSYLDHYTAWVKEMTRLYGPSTDSAGIGSRPKGWIGERLYFPEMPVATQPMM